MGKNLKLQILTPEKEFFQGIVKQINIETMEGRRGILSGHVNLIAALKPSITKYIDINDKKYKIFTSTGIAKVNDSEIIILVDAAEKPEEIDIKRAEQARKRAEERIINKNKDNDLKRSNMALIRAMTRIKISNL